MVHEMDGVREGRDSVPGGLIKKKKKPANASARAPRSHSAEAVVGHA